MSTRTRSRAAGQAVPTVSFKSKSDFARHYLTEGLSIRDVADRSSGPEALPGTLGRMDYSFVYGVAKRFGLAKDRADRKKTARVKVDSDSGIVTLRLDTGTGLQVDLATGKVKRIK